MLVDSLVVILLSRLWFAMFGDLVVSLGSWCGVWCGILVVVALLSCGVYGLALLWWFVGNWWCF